MINADTKSGPGVVIEGDIQDILVEFGYIVEFLSAGLKDAIKGGKEEGDKILRNLTEIGIKQAETNGNIIVKLGKDEYQPKHDAEAKPDEKLS